MWKLSMVNENAKVRRFEPGASGMGFDGFMEERGYKIAASMGNSVKVIGPGGGRPRKLTWAQWAEIRDAERVKAGLEPIKRPRMNAADTRSQLDCK